MQFIPLLAQASDAPPAPTGGGIETLLLMLVPLVLLFVWMTRSQKRKDRERQEMLGAIKKGDKVVTVGGVHGEVSRVAERDVWLLVDKSKGVEIRFQKGAIGVAVVSEQKGNSDKESGSDK